MNFVLRQDIIEIFPLTARAFGLKEDWVKDYAGRLIDPAYLVMILLLVVWIAYNLLKGFENINFERKVWGIPLLVALVGFWPTAVLELKTLVDTFNTYLIYYVFQLNWQGIGYGNLEGDPNILWWSIDALARLLPNLAYWILYSFFIVYLFFYTAMGPFVLAKGIIYDEVDTFTELTTEILMLFLWQTTLIILIGFLLPELILGEPIGSESGANVYFRCLLLGILTLFVPSITRKFGNHLGYKLFNPGLARVGSILAFSGVARAGSKALAVSGIHTDTRFSEWVGRALMTEDVISRYQKGKEIEDLRIINDELRSQYQSERMNLSAQDYNELVDLSRRAEEELGDERRDQ